MKITNMILPVAALGVAASLLTPATEGYSLLGFTLATGQRDFRTFNNFTDTAANNNQNPNVNFPGYQGADMAIWKACIEWNSELHGTGNGDPHQPGDLGSGGANFDAVFQGGATSVGGINDNTHSELPGSAGGVLAFTESPSSNGWRIRYYSGWLWSDGPGVQGSGIDLQGVACHEYGHALGLGHSTVGGTTMFASISGNGIPARSIANDDKNGIRAAYGIADFGTKPRITDVVMFGSQVTVTGQNFTPTANKLWFTQAGVGGNGTAIKVLNLNSTNGGTQLTATFPAAAGPGDILVKITGGLASLSNSWPIDPGVQGCPPPTNYCTSSPNSVGSGAVMGTSGTQVVADNDFGLFAGGLPANQNGVFFYGAIQQNVPFGNGQLCIAGQVFRLDVVQSDVFGITQFALDITNPATPSGQITAGSTWNFQHWYRDPAAGGAFFNLSDGVEVTFCN